MPELLNLLRDIRAAVWGFPLLGMLGVVGVYLSVKLRFLQFRFLLDSLRMTFLGDRGTAAKSSAQQKAGDISNFQALMTSLAAAIGTGNIAGVATAIAVGGLGSLFWMWVMAFLGMVIKYAEALLAVKYRVQNSGGQYVGGPMYYLFRGCCSKPLAYTYAGFGVFACIGTGNLIQSNSVADAMQSSFGISNWMTGTALLVLVGFVILGGVQRIGRLAEKVVPAMSLLYVLWGCGVLVQNSGQILPTFARIFSEAFGYDAMLGGVWGGGVALALREGFARGVLSNEAGLGTSAIASAAAITDHPGRPAMIAMTSVFLSTIVVCTLTGLVIGVSGVLGPVAGDVSSALTGAPLAIAAFNKIPYGELVVTSGLALFALTTIIGWAYYGEKMTEFLLGRKGIPIFRLIYLIGIWWGARLDLELAWTLADIFNAFMVLPNLIGILMLTRVVRSETDQFIQLRMKER